MLKYHTLKSYTRTWHTFVFMSEDQIQKDIVVWFNNNHCRTNQPNRAIIFAVPNGGSRNKFEAIKLKATGTLAGVSDLIVLIGGRSFFVEVKDHKGTQSPGQIDFESRVKDQGFNYFLVRSLQEFQNLPIFVQPNNE